MIADTGPFIILDSVDSTNNYAMAQLHAGTAFHGTAYFAHEQRSGKGRRGKSWHTQKGKNIILSLVLNTGFLPVYQQFQLSMASSLACFDFLHRFVTDGLKIKWPNDLYWNDRKAGGLLIENIIKGDLWQWAVIGIGININQTTFNDDLPNPVSLKQITGETYDTVSVAKELVVDILTRFDELRNNKFENLYHLYNQSLYKLNQQVRLKKENIVFETTITGVDRRGQLMTKNAMEMNFDFDEVEWLL
jgi:birA, biotin-[acetyl-CoA-carboxylase] ligase region